MVVGNGSLVPAATQRNFSIMPQRKISHIECGKYEPSVDDIIAFCHFFKVSADYLLGIPDKYRKK